MASDQVVQLYGTSTGGSDSNVANITVPFDGFLDGIQLSHIATLNADAEESVCQVSEIATQQTTTNEARSVLAVSSLRAGLLTSGAVQAGSNFYVPVNRRVDTGALLYLHFNATASINSAARAVLYFSRRRV